MKTTATVMMMAIIISLLNACGTPQSTDENSFLYSVPVGSRLVLKQPIPVKANTARTFFQYGKIIPERELNIYYPHCSLTTNTLKEYDRLIQPTVFEIYKVIDDEEYAQHTIKYASLNFFGHSDGPTIIGNASYYYLRSAKEPDVRTLECVQWGSPQEVRYLSIKEVRSALGKLFDLQINKITQ